MDIGIYKPVNSEVRGVTAGNPNKLATFYFSYLQPIEDVI
jgi:hypothetical protein